MCGIVGYVGYRPAVEFLLQGLHRLEYRGYDSSGVATISPEGRFERGQDGRPDRRPRRQAGRNARPRARSASATPAGPRTAPPTDENAHPHIGGQQVVAIAHNGVIENFRPLQERLESEGYIFRSATDSEVIAHLIASCLEREQPADGEPQRRHPADDDGRYDHLVRAVAAALAQLHGTYGLAILFRDYPDVLFAARLGSPLVVGVGDGEHFLASDGSPLAGHTDNDRLSGRS